jgi:hypothetical protein
MNQTMGVALLFGFCAVALMGCIVAQTVIFTIRPVLNGTISRQEIFYDEPSPDKIILLYWVGIFSTAAHATLVFGP